MHIEKYLKFLVKSKKTNKWILIEYTILSHNQNFGIMSNTK